MDQIPWRLIMSVARAGLEKGRGLSSIAFCLRSGGLSRVLPVFQAAGWLWFLVHCVTPSARFVLQADRRQTAPFAQRDEAASNQWELQASTQGLKVHSERKYFPDGRIELRCRATINTVPPVVRESSVSAQLASNVKLAQRSPATRPARPAGTSHCASVARVA